MPTATSNHDPPALSKASANPPASNVKPVPAPTGGINPTKKQCGRNGKGDAGVRGKREDTQVAPGPAETLGDAYTKYTLPIP